MHFGFHKKKNNIKTHNKQEAFKPELRSSRLFTSSYKLYVTALEEADTS